MELLTFILLMSLMDKVIHPLLTIIAIVATVVMVVMEAMVVITHQDFRKVKPPKWGLFFIYSLFFRHV